MPRLREKTLNWLVTCSLLLVAVVGYGLHLIHNQAYFDANICSSHLRNFSSALERYADEHHHHYPRSLKQLVPRYLGYWCIPDCPAAGRDTYSDDYWCSQDLTSYRVFCAGDNHGGVGLQSDFPRIQSPVGAVIYQASDIPK